MYYPQRVCMQCTQSVGNTRVMSCVFIKPRLHDTTGCQTVWQPCWTNSHCSFNRLYNQLNVCIHDRFDNRLYRVHGFYITIYATISSPPQKKIITHKDLDSLLQSVVLCGVLRPVCGFQTYRFSENDPFSWTVCKESCRDSWTTNDQYAK